MRKFLVFTFIVFGMFIFLDFKAHAQFEFCQSADPSHPLEMNTVEAARLFKTVAMEKEVFYCGNDPQSLNAVVDLETFIEIIESPRELGRVVEKRVEVARCEKIFGGPGALRCTTREILLEPGSASLLANCTPPQREQQPSDPVEMNTVASRDGTVKTIKLEKEVFQCGPFIGDLYLFTEIIERPSETETGLPTLRPIDKRFEGIMCLKDPKKQDISRCYMLKF